MGSQLPQAGFPLTCNPRSGEEQLAVPDLPLARADCAKGKALLGYRRCREYDDRDGEGQDYAWLFADRERVIAVLADGVSESFYGQIAAQQVVNGLEEYLREGNPFNTTQASRQALITVLRNIAQAGAHKVNDYTLRAGLSPIRYSDK